MIDQALFRLSKLHPLRSAVYDSSTGLVCLLQYIASNQICLSRGDKTFSPYQRYLREHVYNWPDHHSFSILFYYSFVLMP